jgi:hypothetical protein
VPDAEKGMVAQAIKAVSDVAHSLPPSFIILALLNCFFIVVLFYYLLEQQADRTALLKQMIESCLIKQ